MNKVYTFCCKRCGSIFESTGDPDFCVDCRRVIYNSAKKARTDVKFCHQCGKLITSYKCSSKRFCEDCRAARNRENKLQAQQERNQLLREVDALFKNPVEKWSGRRSQNDIAAAVKQAQSEGLSYGEFMALKRSGKI